MVTIATNRTVDRDELIEFLRPRHHGVLLTVRRDGRPQASLVSMGISDAPSGSASSGAAGDDATIVISTYPERAKSLNIRRDPSVSVVVQSDDFGGAWVQVDGTATVTDMPDALDGLVDYYRSIAGEHPDWDEYRAAMVRQDKSLIRVTIDRWGPIATGGFPARLAD